MSSYLYAQDYDDDMRNHVWPEFHRLACGCLGDDRIDPRLDCSGHGTPKPWKCGHKDESHIAPVDSHRYCDSCEEELMKWACGCPNRGSGTYGPVEGPRIVMNCPGHEHYMPWGCGHTDDPGRFRILTSKGCRKCHGRRAYQMMKEKHDYHHEQYEAACEKVQRYHTILMTELSRDDLEFYTKEREDWRQKRNNHSRSRRQVLQDARKKFERVHDIWNEDEWRKDYERFRPIMPLLLRA